MSNSGKENLNVKIGNGATHLLAFPKNHHGEGSVFAAFELPPVQEVYRPVRAEEDRMQSEFLFLQPR